MNSNNTCQSAGFISPITDFNETPYTYGESQSLRLKSNPSIDNILLQGLLIDKY
jgi:hypothetical protein